ncbi:hypothetical protein [Paraburkholderia unamae]|uniref:Uncharacterized protein n=1 Tax=Paraburkholderia unamae TaxID=219649 RepID=A0ACC6RGM7_9BURK
MHDDYDYCESCGETLPLDGEDTMCDHCKKELNSELYEECWAQQ